VVSSVAVPIPGAFDAGAANGVPTPCEANSFGIVSGVGSPSGGAPLVFVSISSRFDDGEVGLPRFTDIAEPVAGGPGLGIGVASPGAGRAAAGCAVVC
jgi:hypothetical protein